jgi:hypothetical protein
LTVTTDEIAYNVRGMEPVEKSMEPEEPPPFLSRWNRVYAAVVVYLGILITLLYIITRMFRP